MGRTLSAVLFSLFLHFALGGATAYWGKQLLLANEGLITKAEAIDFEILEQAQIVRALNPDHLPKSPDNTEPARFRSAQRIRVSEETRAQEIGRTTNRLPMARPASSLRTTPPKRKLDSESQSLTSLTEQSLASLREIPLPAGVSTIGEMVDDSIRVGNITALNTDPLTYYSFFARLEDLIRFRWEREVYLAIQRMSQQQVNVKVPPTGRWRTILSIQLDKQGRFLRAVLLQSSGLEPLDLAPARAFRQATQIPNPPMELLNDEQEVELVLGFNVQTEAWSLMGTRPTSNDSRQVH